MQHIRIFLLIIVFISTFSGLRASSPPPINDTVCDAIDLGMLPLPGLCPSAPYGDTIQVIGTTDWASYNTFDFSPVHCFQNGSPDVWYRFRGTGSFIYLEMTGFNDLDSFFVRLHSSQGSCLSLVPLTCAITQTGFLQATLLTPEVGGEYYLQIGGSMYDETGGFTFSMKSFNECQGCVKNASVELTPAPWFGRYGTSDTVQMCVTVERWDQTTSSLLHAIVPVFGDEWDTTTLTPVTFPGNAGSGWIWGQNIATPAGALDGFYFDGNSDGDPTNNAGDPGNAATTWTGCWSIATKPFCNSYDAFVEVNIYSDNQTGSGNATAMCQEYWPIHLGLSGWCCPDPVVSVNAVGSCATAANITVDPVSVNSADTFDVVLYDDSMHVFAYYPGITGSAIFTGVPSGDYLIEAYNVSTGCISFHQVHIEGAFDIDITQTVVGCGPGSGSVVATPVGGSAPFVYNWPNITTFNDSLAFNLDQGYVVVQISDALGCSVTDSLFVTVQPTPGATFGYADISYCHNDDTIQVYVDPFTAGGTYSLVSPTTSTITVDPVTGTISLNGATVAAPYYVYVEYSVGPAGCTAAWIDSVQITTQPTPPVASTPQTQDWCIGSAPPVITIAFGSGVPLWYDVQTTQTGAGYSFTPMLNASTTPGQYLYGFIFFSDFTFGCASLPTLFAVNAINSPVVTMSQPDTICPGDSALLYATGSASYTYAWTPAPTAGSQVTQFTATSPAQTTTYTCTVSDGACVTLGTTTVFVEPCTDADTGMTVYTGFTPNGDGQNDLWIIDGVETRTNVTVTIYNRWGHLVWKRNNYDNTAVVWRGDDDSGNPLPSGTYYYIITQDAAEPARGWLELTR